MATVRVDLELEGDLAALLQETKQPLEQAARQMIVLELYRRGAVSSGRAAELLGMPRANFIRHASELGIPYLRMSKHEWDAEKAAADML